MKKYLLIMVALVSWGVGQAGEVSFSVMVFDKRNREPIPGAEVKIVDMNSLRPYTQTASDSGIARFELNANARYRIDVSKDAKGSATVFLTYSYVLTDKELNAGRIFEVELEKVQRNNAGMIPSTFFDYKKTELNSDNLSVLDNAVAMLKQFPTLQIEVGVHADCREALDVVSLRVLNVERFFADKGDMAKRVTVRNYGKSKALNQCDCALSIPCSEAQYFENRRAEFKIIAF